MCQRKTGCVIMASGLGKRFGSNKLLAEFRGKKMIEWILETTGGNLFAERVVVTRYLEVASICEKQGVNVILHDLPYRNDTIRLGLEAMQTMPDGCMFCPSDQPLLTKGSLKKMVRSMESTEEICRLAYGEKMGAPVLFGSKYFEELQHLPEGKGGNVLIKKYEEKVRKVKAVYQAELMDADTPQILKELEQIPLFHTFL